MKASNTISRSDAICRLGTDLYDTLVIGGGIVGSGIARDAAVRGLRTALVDRDDFASGTSSRSSRLLHGGLRYLEQGRVGLVREASLEKKVVRHIAPHLAQPLGFVFPAYKRAGRPLWQLRIGVKLYDLLCSGRNFQPSRGFSKRQTLAMLPSLSSDGLLGSVRYSDALTNDARLVIDTIRAAAQGGATVANRVEFCSAERKGDIWVCVLKDNLNGSSFTLRARTIVNATGPWAQQVQHSTVKLRLSKGIHLVVERSRLPIGEDAVVITEGKRILFVIPWGERVIVGTTDTDYQAKPEDVAVNPEDVDYVLRTLNEAFPTLQLKHADILSSWAGLRALIANPDGTPSDISRAHEIRLGKPGWWDVSGGKLTTYRLMAEQTIDRIFRYLGRQRRGCVTAREPLLTKAMETRYSGIVPPDFCREAVVHYVENEWALSLVDVLLRRSSWHYYCKDSAAKAEQVSRWMAELCGWSEERRQLELREYRRVTTIIASAA